MEWIKTIRKRLWLILILPFIAAGSAYAISIYLLTPVYETNIVLYIYHGDDTDPVNSDKMVTLQYLVKDYTELIKSRAVIMTVISNLGLANTDPEKLTENITVNSRNNTNVIEITLQNENPEMAVMIANEVGRVFISEVNRLVGLDNVSIVDSAALPMEPVAPNVMINTLAACFAGFLLALGVAFLLEFADDTIKTEQDVLKHTKLDVLGIIPKYS